INFLQRIRDQSAVVMKKKNGFTPILRFKHFFGDWKERSLEDVAQKIQDGTHFSPEVSENGEFMYITSKNIRNGYLDLRTVEFISREQHEQIYKRCDVKFGDILLTKDGANTGNAC